MNADTSHLQALITGLAHERQRLRDAKSEGERKLRSVWVAQREREVAAEEKFLGMSSETIEMSDDDLLAELMA